MIPHTVETTHHQTSARPPNKSRFRAHAWVQGSPHSSAQVQHGSRAQDLSQQHSHWGDPDLGGHKDCWFGMMSWRAADSFEFTLAPWHHPSMEGRTGGVKGTGCLPGGCSAVHTHTWGALTLKEGKASPGHGERR